MKMILRLRNRFSEKLRGFQYIPMRLQNLSLLSLLGGPEFWRLEEILKNLRKPKSPRLQTAKAIYVGLPLVGFCNWLSRAFLGFEILSRIYKRQECRFPDTTRALHSVVIRHGRCPQTRSEVGKRTELRGYRANGRIATSV